MNGVATTYTIKDRNQASAISGIGCTLFDINGNMTYRVYDASGPKTTYTYVSSSTQAASLFRVARSSFPLRTVHRARDARTTSVTAGISVMAHKHKDRAVATRVEPRLARHPWSVRSHRARLLHGYQVTRPCWTPLGRKCTVTRPEPHGCNGFGTLPLPNRTRPPGLAEQRSDLGGGRD